MKVHPTPRKRGSASGPEPRHRKLLRLPHVFSRVLELPFPSDADVRVYEDAASFSFAFSLDGEASAAPRVLAVDVHSGVTKVVIREEGRDEGVDDREEDGQQEEELLLDDLQVDRWRFRLPPGTLPGLATASYSDGEIVVVVPKDGREVAAEGEEDDDGGDLAGFRRLVIVQ